MQTSEVQSVLTHTVHGVYSGTTTAPPMVKNVSLPPGCVTIPTDSSANGGWSLMYNDVSPVSHTRCGAGPGSAQAVGSVVGGDVAVDVALDTTANVATLTLACVANGSWFGVGLNASSMSGAYAIVVDGTAQGAGPPAVFLSCISRTFLCR